MFAKSEAVQEILDSMTAEEKQTFVGKVKEILAQFKQWINDFLGLYKSDSEEAEALRKAANNIDELIKMWDDMLKKSLTANKALETAKARKNKNSADKDGVVQLSNKITAEDTDARRTEILSKKSVVAPIYEGQADSAVETNVEKLNSGKMGLVKKALVLIGEQFEIFGEDIRIKDVDIEITLSKSNLKESVSKKATPTELAKLLPILNESVSNAIGIERHDNRYFFDNDTVFFENLLGGYADTESFVPVRFGLKHSKSGKATLYVVVDQNKIPRKLLIPLEEKNKTEVINAATSSSKKKETASRSAKYNISQIISFVKSKDLLRYLPDDMLDDEQKTAKWEAIAETIKATNEKNDIHYANFIEKGNYTAAKGMVEEVAKANGYIYEAWHGTRATFNTFSKDKLGTNTNTRVSEKWFFAADKDTANSYYPYGVIEALQGKEAAEKLKNKGNLYHLFLKMENPLIVDVRNYDYAAHREKADAWMEFVEQAERDRNDGIILYNALDNQLKTKSRKSTVYMFKEPNQAKSAEPITYDDNGNIIPLSERFNSENDDIRYSDKTTETDTDLLKSLLDEEELRSFKEREALYQNKIKRLSEQLKSEKKPSKGKVYEHNISGTAAHLLEHYGSKYKKSELVKDLDELYDRMIALPGTVKDFAYGIASKVYDGITAKKTVDENAASLLAELKIRRIKLDSEQLAEIENSHGDGWRTFFRNRVVIDNKNGTPLDEVWKELSDTYPDRFVSDISSADQPTQLLDIIDDLRRESEVEEVIDAENFAEDFAEELFDTFWNLKPYTTAADKYEQKLAELRKRNIEKSKARTVQIREKLAEQKSQARSERREAVTKVRESYRRKALLKGIYRCGSDLAKAIANPTKEKHIPEAVQPFVKYVLESLDFSSKQLLGEKGTVIENRGLPTKRDESLLSLMEAVPLLIIYVFRCQKSNTYNK